MAERVLVLSADTWEMPDERTGEIRKGVSVWYVNSYREDDVKSVGFKPTKLAGTFEAFDQLRVGGVPSMYEVDFGTRPGKDNKASLTLIGAKHVGKVDLFARAAAK
jgi:hypothetical protein